MNRDTVQGGWKQLKGRMQVQWGKLTGDYLRVITGRCTQIDGERQCAYAIILSETLRGKKTRRHPDNNASSSLASISDSSLLTSVVVNDAHENH